MNSKRENVKFDREVRATEKELERLARVRREGKKARDRRMARKRLPKEVADLERRRAVLREQMEAVQKRKTEEQTEGQRKVA